MEDEVAFRSLGQPSLKGFSRPVVPILLEMRDKAWDEDQVERAITNDLVRDIDVTALGVASLGS